MGSMSDFYTREAGNQGTKVPLTKPDGSKSDDYLIVRSVDSDAFREAEAEGKRNVFVAAQTDDIKERQRIARESTLLMQTALVKDWSFDEPCTPENIRDFLINAPHIADAIDQFCAKRSLFTEKKSKGSGSSRATKSNSPKSRKAQAPQKAHT